MSVTAPGIPHLAYPVVIDADGALATTQGGLDEIAGCVRAILACPLGACPELPAFGIPDVTFQTAPPNLAAIMDAVQQLEPRAAMAMVTESMLDNTGGVWQAQATFTPDSTGQ